MRPVARVRAAPAEPVDRRWGDVISTIELDDAVPDEALAGLDEFSHVEVVFYADRAREDAPWSRRPRDDPRWPVVGVFANRAKDRPNRILTTSWRSSRSGRARSSVRGLDAIDGTPVLDLKPWLTLERAARRGARAALERRARRGVLLGRRRDEGGEHRREQLAAVLLEEVPRALDGHVLAIARAGHELAEPPVAAAGDRVGVAEAAQERPVEGRAASPRPRRWRRGPGRRAPPARAPGTGARPPCRTRRGTARRRRRRPRAPGRSCTRR